LASGHDKESADPASIGKAADKSLTEATFPGNLTRSRMGKTFHHCAQMHGAIPEVNEYSFTTGNRI
jgi:hypothetical protein